ncbi:MAG: CotH kinase family protein [Verrucomicrobiia bacterium]
MKRLCFFSTVLLFFTLLALPAAAQVMITEFMASNTHTLLDEDGDSSDWIEIENTSGSTVNLLNWALTDSAGNPTKWLFPSTNIAPGDFMVIFASGKDRRAPGQELHTNFKLSADGEYLALFRPDRSTATEIAPQFPSQFPDVSYGLGMQFTTTPLVATNAAIHYLIPADASVDAIWTQTAFDDSSWLAGTNGIGYETGIVDPQEESFAAKVLATQPEAYWRLNETTGPTAANLGSDGVSDGGGYLGNVVLGGAGPRPPAFPTLEANNNAPVFDGSSAYINGPYELLNDLPAFTIAAWICPAATPNSLTGLFGQIGTMELGFNTPTTIQIWTPAGSVSAPYPYATNTWHYITAVGGNGQLALYFDGTLAGNTMISAANFGESEYDFNIGGGGIFDTSGNYFQGQIDEVAVWFRALATNEITALLASNADQVSYTNYINTDVLSKMYGVNATAYVRLPFTISDTNTFNDLQLFMRYDDGFAAFLNGHLIASANAPGESPTVPALTDLGTTAPTPGSNDVSQLLTSGQANMPDGLNYYTDNQTGHSSGEPGQTFTTPSGSSQYLLNSLAIKTGGGSTSGTGTPQNYVLHIYSVSGSTATLLATYNATNFTFGDGDWLQWRGLSLSLSTTAVYAYSFGKASANVYGWEQLGNAIGNLYSGGELGLMPVTGGTITFGSSHGYDAVFDVGLILPASLAWNSSASQRHLDPQSVQWAAFDVSAARQWLQTGSNVLAIQAMNIAATNTDFLMQAQLLGLSVTGTNTGWRYFTGPTPGAPNGTSATDFGPIMSGAAHSPNVPATGGALTVTAQAVPGFNPIANVTLHYRAMFNSEVSVPMSLTDPNGTWTGTIPGGVATAGQLLRYYVTAVDTAGNASRWPIFANTTDSQQYLGTVVSDPSVQSQLPVASLFIQNPGAADNRTGTAASLFYLNELYDNLNIYVHGQSSVGWPKKSHNLDFPKDHQFLYTPNGIREKKVIFISNYGDKARMCTTLTYATTAMSGGMSLFSFPIRIQLNGAFWGVEDLVEHGDDLWLDRIGRDGNGALYKMYNNLSSASGNEKKTRDWEGTDDLAALVAGLDESIPLANRVLYGYDNLDLPQTASYFADMALASSQDVAAKNYYLYRDSDGTGEWAITPWDVDLTWGRNWIDAYGYFTDTIYTNNVLNFDNPAQQWKPANRLFDLFFGSADFRQMYLRRLRTLMDTILMPPGTPTNALVIEPLIRQYESRLNPAGISPSDTVLDYAAWGPWWGDTTLSQFPNFAEQIISTYLPGRRNFLYSTNAALNGDFIPAAQPANTVVLIGSWDYNPASGNQNEQYVELRNTNAFAVDVSYWRLTGGIEFSLRPGTVIPAGKSLYLAANVNAFRTRAISPHAGQGLFVQGAYGGLLSTQGNTPLILKNDKGMPVSKNSYAGNSSSATFVAGNLAVLRVGDGTQTLGNRGNSVFIDQFTTNGTLVGSVPMPDNATNALIVSGSASSEGALTRSADGRLLEFAGYQIALTNAALLGSSLANANATNAPRALGIADIAGTFALVGVTTNQYSGNNLRSGATDGRGNYWGAGANSGTFYFGSSPTNTVQNTVANSVVIQDLGGNLYFSTSKTTPGVWKIPGTPAVPTPTAVFLPTGAGSSPYGFALSPDLNTAYIADDTLTGKGGVQRWDYNGSTWALSYAFAGITNVGARGLAVDFSGANPVIYATTAEAAANRLVSLTDNGAAATATTLATAGVNQLFRGVSFTPSSGSVPQFFKAATVTNGFALSWTALLNRNYTVQYNDDLNTTNWLTLTNLTAATPVMTVIDPGASASSSRFYRVVLNP